MENFNSIGIIGTGKAASALLRHFTANHIHVEGIWGRNRESAAVLGDLFDTKVFSTKKELVLKSQMLILAVNDNSIGDLARELATEMAGASLTGKTFSHLSGALCSSELDPLKALGANILSSHIIQSLAGNSMPDSPDILENVWFSLEGDVDAVCLFKELLGLCKNPSFEISRESKPLYHGAMCVFSNYLVALLSTGFKMLETTGLDAKQTYNVVLPLLSGTLSNVRELGPEAALTGPISRGDSLIIETHIATIKDQLPEVLDLYCSMGLETQKIAKKESPTIRDMLKRELTKFPDEII